LKRYKEILLIEDDLLSRFITQMVLEQHDIANSVVCKYNGEEALDYLKDTYLVNNKLTAGHCPDIILLDINMPVMDGFEFLQALQELDAETLIYSKVVILSTSNDERDKAKARSFGVKGCLEKPITIEKLQTVF
jgi:CheY-like chemotaxis protein